MSHLLAKSLQRRAVSFLTLAIALSLLSQDLPARAQPAPNPANPLYIQPRDRIGTFIDDEKRVALRGNRHPLALAQHDAGSVAPNYRMERMLLTLLPDAAPEEALNQFVDAQHSPESPYFHECLTPEPFAERLGVSETDAAQVEAAFHTQIHAYKAADKIHHANVNDPEIPAALAQVVGGVVSLHDFHSEPLHAFARKPSPEFTSGGAHYLAPADFAAIYNLVPLCQQSINGNGQSIAIVGRSNVKIADVRQFRTAFGLPANDPQIIVNRADPGIFSSGKETEADLDVEWSGAVARNATIKFVVSKSTNSSDGVDRSAQYIVNHNLAPVMSISFGLCEAWLGSSGNRFLSSLWQQAAAQGVTVVVSSGDNGAAGCDSPSAAKATNGRGVNGLCSTPSSVCVGGTQFSDSSRPSLYWSSSNSSALATKQRAGGVAVFLRHYERQQ
jgi:pseudomonalisin